MGIIDDAYEYSEDNDYEFYDPVSVSLGELYEDGFVDFNDESWAFPKYSDEQHARLCRKILNHYYDRSICIVPPGAWKREFLRKMDEIMPKYVILYSKLDGKSDLMNATDEWYKSRNVVSDFPQTQLGGNQDYASMGRDSEYERVRDGTILDLAERLKTYDDVDLSIINDIETLFSCLFTVSINAW